jgi:methylated-DNA-[protein]-cysteine S-methyltransferase
VTELTRSLRGFAERAAAEDLIDVAYAEVDSPFGALLAAATPAGLVRLSYPSPDGHEGVLEDLARRVSPRVLEAPPRLDPVRRELDEYFSGRRRRFGIPVDLRLVGGDFGRRVLERTAEIPFGDVLTYAEVAARAGSARASRAAGNALGANPVPIVVPCHRIVAAGGALGGYTGGLDRKRALLAVEGR